MSAKASWRVCVAMCMASAMVASSVLANTATPTRTKTPPPTPMRTKSPPPTPITPTPLPTNTPICPTALPTNTPPPTPTPTPAPGTQGCSHGYWKEHPTVWPAPYDPTDILGDVFALGPFVNLNGDNVPNDSLLDALFYTGGDGPAGGARNLLKQAVGALLNAASGFYPLTTAQVIGMVNSALATGNRSTMLTLASSLDNLNNLGCPCNNLGCPPN